MQKKKKEKWKNVLVLIVTLLLFLIISEIAFRIYTRDKKEFLEHSLEEYESMWEGHFSVSLDQYDHEPKQGVFRIAVLGDSFTFGEGTEDGIPIREESVDNEDIDNSYPQHLNSLLDSNFNDYEYEVLNFGMGGSSSFDELLILKKHVLDYNPNLIILSVTNNDQGASLFCLDPARYCGLDLNFYEKTLSFYHRHFRLLSYITMSITSHKYEHPANIIASRPGMDVPENSISYRCYKYSLKRIHDVLVNHTLPHMVVFIYDTKYQKGKDNLMNYIDEEFISDTITKPLNSAGFDSIVYTYHYFRNIPFGEIVSDDLSHYNIKGNLAIAKIVYNYLLENEMLPSCEVEDCKSKLIEIGV